MRKNKVFDRFLIKKTQLVALCFFISHLVFSKDIYVAVVGSDSNTGTKKQPFASIERAVSEANTEGGKETVTIWMGEGTYYLSETLLFDASFSGTIENPFTMSSLPGARVTLKGSKVLDG